MNSQGKPGWLAGALCAAMLVTAAAARAELSAEELAKLAPVGNLISERFQNNTNLNFGPEKGTQNILNIQPVIPISVDKVCNIITRTTSAAPTASATLCIKARHSVMQISSGSTR